MDIPDPDPRAAPRHKVFRQARLTGRAGDGRCHILNLSSSGALVDSRAMAATGVVSIATDAFAREATVRWAQGSRLGLRFASPLAPAEFDATLSAGTHPPRG